MENYLKLCNLEGAYDVLFLIIHFAVILIMFHNSLYDFLGKSTEEIHF